MKPTIIAIGYAKQLFIHGSRERERALLYARETDSYHVIVFTRKSETYSDIHEGNFHVYATCSRARFMMLIRAFILGKDIIRTIKKPHTIIVTAQDPLEAGWLSWLLTKEMHTHFHVQVHGDYLSSGEWVGYSPLRYIRRFCGLILLKHAPAIRVASERIKKSLVTKGIAEEKISVLPIRPELEVFLRAPHTYSELFPRTFLSLGRLAPEKDIERIVKAFEIVHPKYPDTTLRIVGDGSEKSNLMTLIQKQKCASAITLVPWTNDAAEEMGRADVFLLASKHEAYALTLIEAMAVGLPIVTTDVGCVGEVVKDTEHGIVVTEKTVVSYARAMERMITESGFRKQCGEAGKNTARAIAETPVNDYAHAWVRSISFGVSGGV